MRFQDIIRQLEETQEVLSICNDDSVSIHDIAFVETQQLSFEDDALYFAFSEQLEKNRAVPLNCILAGRVSTRLPQIRNCAVVDRENFFSVFNAVKAMFDARNDKRLFSELTEVADRHKNIDAVLDLASQKLDNPLVFCDVNFRIISYSKRIPLTDPIWGGIVQRGYTPYEFNQAFQDLEPSFEGQYDKNVAEVSCSESPYRKLRCHIAYNGNRIGVVIMIASKSPVSPRKMEMLSTVRDALNYTISRYVRYLETSSSSYQQLLYDLLSGAKPENLFEQIERLSFAPRLTAIGIRTSQHLGMKHLKEITSGKLKKLIPGTHVTYLDDTLSAVIPLQDTAIPEKTLALLEDLAREENLMIGVSNIFTDISYFKQHDYQARQALRLARKMESDELVSLYSNYQFYDILFQFDSQKQLGLYCHPALMQLREFDLEHNTTLYLTLQTYLDCGCKATQTANQLFIHRNSLTYRLDKITKLCGLDLEDSNTCFMLQVSYKIHRFLELMLE